MEILNSTRIGICKGCTMNWNVSDCVWEVFKGKHLKRLQLYALLQRDDWDLTWEKNLLCVSLPPVFTLPPCNCQEAEVDFSFQKILSHNSVAARFDQYIVSLLSDGHPNINTEIFQVDKKLGFDVLISDKVRLKCYV